MNFKRFGPLKLTIALSLFLHMILLFRLWRSKLEPFFPSSFSESVVHPGLLRSQSQPIFIDLHRPSPRQIVVSEAGKQTSLPDKNAFLGERNQRVDKQTISTQGNLGSQQGPGSKEKNSNPEQKRSKKNSSSSNLATIREPAQVKELAKIDLKKCGLPLFPLKNREIPIEPDQSEWSSFGGMGSNPFKEYVKGIEESDRTALNTQEFIFYGYFERVRKRLEQVWGPIIQGKLKKQYRQEKTLVSDRHIETKLAIYLDASGHVIRVKVLRTSGVKDLDDSAIEAFSKAGPFPNPPQAMIDTEKEIKLVWNFVLRT